LSENVKEIDHKEGLGLNWVIILKCFKRIGLCDVDWIYLVQDREKLLSVLN
jgi:hypothetical protein